MSGNVYEITLSYRLGHHIGLNTNSAYLARAAQGCDRYVAKGGIEYGHGWCAHRLSDPAEK